MFRGSNQDTYLTSEARTWHVEQNCVTINGTISQLENFYKNDDDQTCGGMTDELQPVCGCDHSECQETGGATGIYAFTRQLQKRGFCAKWRNWAPKHPIGACLAVTAEIAEMETLWRL